MTRAQLEHVIRAAGTIADVEDLIVIGSQSVLGAFPDAPAELLLSKEADLFPREHPERADLIDATIGEGSPFQNSFGYYAHGVGEETAVLPEGWRDRLVLVRGPNTRFVRGWAGRSGNREIRSTTEAVGPAGNSSWKDDSAPLKNLVIGYRRL